MRNLALFGWLLMTGMLATLAYAGIFYGLSDLFGVIHDNRWWASVLIAIASANVFAIFFGALVNGWWARQSVFENYTSALIAPGEAIINTIRYTPLAVYEEGRELSDEQVMTVELGGYILVAMGFAVFYPWEWVLAAGAATLVIQLLAAAVVIPLFFTKPTFLMRE